MVAKTIYKKKEMQTIEATTNKLIQLIQNRINYLNQLLKEIHAPLDI